jgi:hypothetical protein
MMTIFRLLAAGLLAAVLAGCQQSRTLSVSEPFDAKAAAAALQPGNSTIRGSAFMRKLTGVIVPAAGEVVRLVPVNAYSQARFAALYGNAKLQTFDRPAQFDSTPPEYLQHLRETKADKKGDFEFTNVRPGRYFVQTRVYWLERAGGDAPQGGTIYDIADVRGPGQTVEIIISGN